MLDTARGRWTAGCSLGFLRAFLSFLLTPALITALGPESLAAVDLAAIPEHLDPDALPGGMDRGTYASLYRALVLAHLVGLTVFGAVLGGCQAVAMRGRLPGVGGWIVAAALGFAGILALEAVEPHVVTGPYRGPVEPIVIALGGGSLAGLFQAAYLRIRGLEPWRWLSRWLLGLALGIAAAAALLLGVELGLEPLMRRGLAAEIYPWISWIVFLLFYGTIVGAVAGRVSGRALVACPEGSPAGARPSS